MSEQSFNQDFCDHLMFHLTKTFYNSDDNVIGRYWCDGVAMPFVDSQLTKKSVNDTRQIVTTAWLGEDGQQKHEIIIKFGRKALSRYARGLSLIECLPDDTSTDWIDINEEEKSIELQLY